jgi:5,5'-dehydrodivanillate O-demethylase
MMEGKSEQESIDLERTDPGTLAGRYLRRFWLPVYRAEDLPPGRTAPIRIMGEDFTLYRGEGAHPNPLPEGEGTPHLVAFRCAHRGTQLSTGWVEGDCIRCRYHGWKYDGDGQCVEQPGEAEGLPAKVRVRGYPVRDYLGLVFAYLGAGEPPPFLRYPDFERPGIRFAIRPEYWPCNYFNRLDNDPDGFHVLYTHRESIRRANRTDQYATRSVSAEETEYGVRTMLLVPGERREYLHSHMPISNQIRVKTGVASERGADTTAWEDRITWAVPIDAETSARFEVNLVRLVGAEARAYEEARRRALAAQTVAPNELGEAILAGKMRIEDLEGGLSAYETFRIEDYVTQVGQGRIHARSGERLSHSDAGVILRRKLWQEELRALAEGRPLREWTIPAGLADMTAAPAMA